MLRRGGLKKGLKEEGWMHGVIDRRMARCNEKTDTTAVSLEKKERRGLAFEKDEAGMSECPPVRDFVAKLFN